MTLLGPLLRHATCVGAFGFLLGASLLSGCRGTVSREPPIHPNQNMDQQSRFDPQEPNDFFKDGRAMRPPVPGTVIHMAGNGRRDDPHLWKGKNADGSWATTLPMDRNGSPLVLDEAFMTRGKARFDIYCAPCHDQTGHGKGTVVERGYTPPPDYHQDRLRKLAVGQIYDVATNGVRSMPGYAAQVPAEDRWAIAAYVRALQVREYASFEQVPAEVATKNGWTKKEETK